MRITPVALALVLVACSRSEHSAPATSDAPSASTTRGTDQLVLRLPRSGGQVAAFAYPKVDSLVWRSGAAAPPIERVIGFDDEAGSIMAIDEKGSPVRIDLRLDNISRDAKLKLTHLASSDGASVYGIGSDGSVTRLTPSGAWTFKPPSPARDVIPEPDGSLLILADRPGGTMVWQMHPPNRSITDSALLPRVRRSIRTQVGDRVYFTTDSGLMGLKSRGLEREPSVQLDHRIRALTTTPSGDRLYVVTDSNDELVVIDRYSHKTETRITLPGEAADLRMDMTGRYVLVRPVQGDSAWVIAVGTDELVGTVKTTWRSDLPTVAPNGWLALLQGPHVVLVDGATLQEKTTVKEGGKDSWLFVAWNGFRPRASAVDESAPSDSIPPSDSSDTNQAIVASAAGVDSAHAISDSSRAHASPPDTTAAAHQPGFVVQFAALRSDEAAREVAQGIVVEGNHPRVVATLRAGVTIYRVILGPFALRVEAERLARVSGKPYWIYEGAP